jgi:Spy/CpxP family protein refolding chaperone
MKTLVIAIIVVIVFAGVGLIYFRPPSPEQMLEKIFNDISDKLNLNSAQKLLLSSIRDEVIKNGRERHEDFERMQLELSKLILSDRINLDEVKAEAKKKHDKMANLIDHAIARLVEFHATLTPEQKKGLVELMAKHKKIMPPWPPF